ncbi:ABC transporter ATP-binding protein [Candidatus Thorarchaeota archaeon]|nr:MAG: ABC transporter ATP-binding protein [Candidatus Thorarchaeota archaeon]
MNDSPIIKLFVVGFPKPFIKCVYKAHWITLTSHPQFNGKKDTNNRIQYSYCLSLGEAALKGNTIVSVHNLTKRFGNIIALDKLSLRMDYGVFGLIGPNGAGKTTLLRILLGLIEADGGSSIVLEQDTATHSFEIRQRIGVLHERPTYPSSLTVGHFLKRVSNLYETSEDIDILLKRVELLNAKERRIRALSAGMHQKLGIAQALIGKPELVFLDEPTSNLDVMARVDLLRTIRDVHRNEGVSFCIISHVLSELERVCDNVAFINKGKTVVQGPIQEIINEYSSNQYNVVVSDPHILCKDLQTINDVMHVEVTGAKTLTIMVTTNNPKQLRTDIERCARLKGVNVYEMEKSHSLEQAFVEVMRNG